MAGLRLKRQLLLVEDDAAIAEMVQSSLLDAGYTTVIAATAAHAEQSLQNTQPDLALIDWMLPGISGLEFVRRLRRQEVTRRLPIIMLTARCEEADRLAGFDAGVDDYVSKPFSVQELKARIVAVLRRSQEDGANEVLDVMGLKLDPISHRVTGNGHVLKMGPTEFRLLHHLMRNQDRVYSRGQLLDQVWGAQAYVEERTVDVHIRRLRKSLGVHSLDGLIQTVHGIGYRLSRQHAG